MGSINIDPIFPTTEKHIENNYVNLNIEAEIPTTVRDNLKKLDKEDLRKYLKEELV